jgi:SPP1 gp7 family putative phage head morphogenesis protein
MNDFYLGKFFQGDKEVRREVLKWMDNYYLTSGNPIGKGQKGISVFLENFGDKLSDISERKSRQIIDTTMNTIRNFAKVRSYAEANIESFVWDATNDRLTCAACRSLDGRIFKTKYAAAQIDEIITSAPENLPDKRPIITQPFKGKTDDFSLNSPPMHPLCRCTTAAFFDSAPVEYNISRPENVLVTSDQLELEKTFQNLTNDEIHNRVTAHLGSVWARPPKNPQKKHIDQFLGSHIEKKFNKHVLTQNEFPSISSVEKYKQKAYDIIKKPDKVYVEIGTDKKPYYAFFESDIMVIISDDNMSISSMYRIGEEKWLEKQRKAVIRIY